MKGNKGFSLVELLVVVGIMGILMTISVPGVLEWRRNAQFKEAAQTAASTLRLTKGQAINTNQRIRVVFNLDNNAVTTNIVDGATLLSTVIADSIVIKGGTDCTTDSGTVSITFNPNGSSGSGYLCILEGATKKYRVGVSSSTTGRVLFHKWQDGAWK